MQIEMWSCLRSLQCFLPETAMWLHIGNICSNRITNHSRGASHRNN